MNYDRKSATASEVSMSATEAVEQVTLVVEKLHGRMLDVTDSICGSVPREVAQTGQAQRPISGKVEAIQRSVSAIEDMVGSMHAMMDRLERQV